MMYVVRWTDADNQDQAVVIEAASKAEAAYMAARKGVPVVVIEPASDEDLAEARRLGRVWAYSGGEGRYRCLGRPVRPLQLACLLACGLLTSFLILRAGNVQLSDVRPIVQQVTHLGR